jgi:uncharacterized membrane-anchored protein YitT (DUF2179 family)
MLNRYYPALDPGGASGTPCLFTAASSISSSATYYQETENLQGAAGAVVTIQVTTYTNTNPNGRVLVDSDDVLLNAIFYVTLNGSGLGSFVARVQGQAGATGTIVRAVFTIVGVSSGSIGAPDTKQISKTFSK